MSNPHTFNNSGGSPISTIFHALISIHNNSNTTIILINAHTLMTMVTLALVVVKCCYRCLYTTIPTTTTIFNTIPNILLI